MAERATNMLGTECGRLLTPNERAERDGSPDPQGQGPDATGSWHSDRAGRLRSGTEPIGHVGAASVADTRGFSPRAAIAAGSQPYPTSEAEPTVRIRAELEDELEWRLEEMRFFKNQLADMRTKDHATTIAERWW